MKTTLLFLSSLVLGLSVCSSSVKADSLRTIHCKTPFTDLVSVELKEVTSGKFQVTQFFNSGSQPIVSASLVGDEAMIPESKSAAGTHVTIPLRDFSGQPRELNHETDGGWSVYITDDNSHASVSVICTE